MMRRPGWYAGCRPGQSVAVLPPNRRRSKRCRSMTRSGTHGVQDARRPRRGRASPLPSGRSLVFYGGMSGMVGFARFIHRMCGVVRRGRGRDKGVPLSRTHVCALPARESSSRLRGMQYLKDASYNELGEAEFVLERTIVLTRKWRTETNEATGNRLVQPPDREDVAEHLPRREVHQRTRVLRPVRWFATVPPVSTSSSSIN